MAGELVTGPGLIQWGTLLLGRSQAAGVVTPYRWKTPKGWETMPGLDSGTVKRAQQYGAWPGRLLAQPRTITLDPLTVRAPAGQMGAVIAALEAALPVSQDEQPLVIQLDERGPLLVWARVVRFDLPVSSSWQLGYAEGGAIQWEATDPRRYQLAEQVALTGLPQQEVGLSWGSPVETGLDWGSPVETGLAWGAPGSTGDMTCTNAGPAETHPTITITGPCTTPSVALAGTSTVLEYGLALAATDQLVIDCWNGTVLLGGQDRATFATARSVPEELMAIPPGATSTLSFRSADAVPDPAASCTVRWRSAYW
ncbi:phage distal tail protein [Kitasatospora cineracea]